LNGLKIDVLLHDYKIIIELDGRQHFTQVSNWNSPEHNKQNDELKNKLALENGYKIIRICQEIVLYEKEDWENQLYNNINKLINSNIITINKIGSIYLK
jgi:very-short-patch-repair endonuclease